MIANITEELFKLTYGAELFLALSMLILLLLGVKNGDKVTARISYLSIFVLAITLFIIGRLTPVNSIIDNFFIINNVSNIIKTILIIAAIISLFLYIGHLNYNPKNSRFEYPIIILISIIGMLVMVSARDFLTLYMGLEVQSIAIYILVAINRENIKSSEAGIKYFVLGALSSGVMLYGISLIYGFSGSIFFTDLSHIFANNDIYQNESYLGLLIGLILILIGFCFKISAVPFHMWTPDVYEGAPTPVTLYISTVPKVAAFFVMLTMLTGPFLAFSYDWKQILICISVASLLVGSLGAIRQTNLKRLIAYSSINHIGFILLAIISFKQQGMQAMLLYLIIYLVMTFGVFSFLMLIKQSHNSADMADKKPLEDISSYAGLAKSTPMVAIGMTVILLSMAGIPPFAGFFAKFFIFKTILAEGYYKVAVIAAISAVIALYYYLNIIKIMFFDDAKEVYNKSASRITIIIYSIVVLFNLLFFIKPNILFNLVNFF